MAISPVDEGWNTLTAVLSSILAFSKEFKLHTVYWTLFWGFWADKTTTTHWSGGRAQVWVQVRAPADQSRSSGNHSRRLVEKTIEGFDYNINGQTLGAALRHGWRGSDGQAKTQGVSESAAVASGSDQLAWWKLATTLAILTQFDSEKSFMLCRYRAVTTDFVFIGK